MPQPPRLEEQIRGAIRLKHYSRKTEEAYVGWYKQYVTFQAKVWGRMRHPAELGAEDVTAFLTHLVQNRDLAASTQNQAFNALLFLYREVLKIPLEGIDSVRAKRSKHIPVVLTQEETRSLLSHVKGDAGLVVRLLYGCGLRVAEALALRIKDVDLSGGKLEVRGGKGDKDRVVSLPRSMLPALQEHQSRVRAVFDADRRNDVPGVHLPHAMAAKNPSAAQSWPWMWFFPSSRIWEDTERDGSVRRGERAYGRGRHHLHEIAITRELERAAKMAALSKRVTAHVLRHYFATHLVLKGIDIRSIKELLGHADVRTTEIYLQLAKAMRGEITSPLDDL